MAYFEVNKKPVLSFSSVSGAICTFNSQYSGLPLKEHEVAITAIQSGSGTPSPSNPRPISGHSSVTVSHSDADTSNPTTYTRNFGQTVYGGVLNCLTGVVRVTHGYINVSTLTGWAQQLLETNYYQFYKSISGAKRGNYIACNLFKYIPTVTTDNFRVNWGGGTNMCFTLESGDTLTEWNNFISNNDIYAVYELATPTTIQLNPIQLETLLNENNVWADTGNTSLQYTRLG